MPHDDFIYHHDGGDGGDRVEGFRVRLPGRKRRRSHQFVEWTPQQQTPGRSHTQKRSLKRAVSRAQRAGGALQRLRRACKAFVVTSNLTLAARLVAERTSNPGVSKFTRIQHEASKGLFAGVRVTSDAAPKSRGTTSFGCTT